MPRHQSSGHLDKSQQAIHQQPVSGILRRWAIAPTPKLESEFHGETVAHPFHESRFRANFSQVPCRATTQAVIQPKLTIGAVNDKYEQEADRVASQVVNQINAPQSSSLDETIQRQEVEEEDDDKLQMKPLLQRQSAGNNIPASAELEAEIGRSRSGGQPLAKSIRHPMEQAFRADFSRVKVHTDAQSDQLNQSIQAKAFTTGQNIFFRQGAYEPRSREGQKLIAHELTHVVQQGSRATTVQRKVGKRPKRQFTDKVVKEWNGTDGETYQLTSKSGSELWTKIWKLDLLKDGSSKGHIFIYFSRERNELKPDGLEVPRSAQGVSYGSKLGQQAVVAMTSDPIRSETQEARTIYLNLVNPLSAHISLKELTTTINGRDAQDESAVLDGQRAAEGKTKELLYDPAQFSKFWGRLVYLVTNNGVQVECTGFGRTGWVDDRTIQNVDVDGLLAHMLNVRKPAGSFVMNIKAPKPES